MHLLVTRPRYDNATHYLYHWMGRLLASLNKKISIKDIEKEKVEKQRVISYIKKQSPEVIVLNGHGSGRAVLGDSDADLISTSDDLSIFKNKRIYVRSCSAGKILGPELVKSGASGFVGYNQDFIFVIQPDYFNNPVDDYIAAICLNPTDEIIKALIKGHSAKQANESGVQSAQRKLDELQVSSSYNSQFAPFLYWNMSSQVYFE